MGPPWSAQQGPAGNRATDHATALECMGPMWDHPIAISFRSLMQLILGPRSCETPRQCREGWPHPGPCLQGRKVDRHRCGLKRILRRLGTKVRLFPGQTRPLEPGEMFRGGMRSDHRQASPTHFSARGTFDPSRCEPVSGLQLENPRSSSALGHL